MDLATALGVDVPDVTKPNEHALTGALLSNNDHLSRPKRRSQ